VIQGDIRDRVPRIETEHDGGGGEVQGAVRIDDTGKAAPKWRIVGVARASISFGLLSLLASASNAMTTN
jgi:hypothetical protein